LFSTCISSFALWSQPLKGEDARRWQAAWSACQQGRNREALEGFKAVLDGKKDQGLFLQAGALLARQGGQEQAEELYLWGRARLKQPKAFAERLAEIYQSRLKHDLAVREWMKLLPERYDLVRARLSEISQHIGPEKAAAMAEAEAKDAGDAGWLAAGGLYLAAKDDDRAWRAFSRMKDMGLLRKAVDQAAQAGVPVSRQAPMLEEYLDRSGWKEADLLARLGDYYMDLHQFNKASAVFWRMAPLDCPLAAVMAARAELRQGGHERALRLLGQGRPDADWPDSLRWEGRLLEAQARLMSGGMDEARRIYGRLAEDSAAGLRFRQKAEYLLAETYLMGGEADSALAGYRRAVQMGMGGEPSNDAMLRMILISEHKAGRMEGLSLFGRGLAGKAGNGFDEAARSFIKTAEKYPGTTLADQALLELALMREEQGEPSGAADAWRRLAETASDPSLSCRASYRWGMVLRYDLGKPAEAAGVWKQAIVKNPDFSWSDLMRQELSLMKE